MNSINIEALLNTLAPMNFTPQSGAQQTTGNTDGLFLSLLQSFAGNLGGEAQAETAQSGASPGDWLATLFGLLTPGGAPNNLLPTLDSTGEASDGTGEAVSLTDMMAAMQSLAAGNSSGTLTAEQVMQAFTQSAETSLPTTDGNSPEKSLEAIVEELGLAQNPAVLAALTQLQQNASPAQTTTETLDPATVTISQNTGTSQPAVSTPPLTDAPLAAQTDVVPTENRSATAPDAKLSMPAPEPLTTAAKPNADPATTFAKTLNTARNAPSPTAPPTQASTTASTLPASDVTVTRTESVSGEKTVALPTDAPVVVAPQSSAAPTVFAPATVDAPATPTLPNIPALHQLVDTISVLKQNGQTTVRLQLHPESLGQVLVQMHVHNGDVTVQMLAETGKAQSLIQNHLPELKAAFSAQGVSTGALNVSVGSDASAFAAPQRQNFHWQNSGNHTPTAANDDITDVSSAPRSATRRYTLGRIDYHV